MGVNDIQDFHEIKFNRDTKIDYKNGNPLEISLFKQFDTDLSGDFDDTEWGLYQAYLEKSQSRQAALADTSTANHYEKKLNKIDKQLRNLDAEYANAVKTDYFTLMQEFENEHNIDRIGYTNKDEIPDGAETYDISAFQMGIYDEDKGAFTGETYKKGYISGLENLSEEDKKEYLSLLENASQMCTNAAKIEKEKGTLLEKFDKYAALQDLAQNGMLDHVPSAEEEDQYANQYREMMSQSNPFLSQIERLQGEYNALAAKSGRTSEDNSRLEQMSIQIDQLKRASANWRISDLTQNPEMDIQNGSGFSLTNLGQSFIYKTSDDGSGDVSSAASSTNISASYTKGNIRLNAGATYEQSRELPLNSSPENKYITTFSAQYERGGFSAEYSNYSTFDENYTSIYHLLSLQQGSLGFELGRSSYTSSYETTDDEGNTQKVSSTSYTTTAGVSYQAGKFYNTAGVEVSADGTIYSLGSRASFRVPLSKKSKKSSLSLSPSMNVQQNTTTGSTTLNPSLGVNYGYNSENFSLNANLNESWSRTLNSGSSPVDNNTFTTGVDVGYKKVSANVSFEASNYSSYNSRTFEAGVSYTMGKNGKAGTVSLNYSDSKTSYSGGTDSSERMVTAKYSLPLQTINKWFKKK